jgi:hypothetical protein
MNYQSISVDPKPSYLLLKLKSSLGIGCITQNLKFLFEATKYESKPPNGINV